VKEYDVKKASSLPSKEQMTGLSSQGWDLVQIVVYKGEIFVYLERIWSGVNIVVQGFEYNTLEAASLPNQDNLGEVLTGEWELVQLIPTDTMVYAYVRRPKNGVH
jgi:hypothetical protein